jgi:hypothetical protein
MDKGLLNIAWAVGLEGYYQECVAKALNYPRQMAVVAYSFHIMASYMQEGIKRLHEAPAQEPSWYSWLNK